MKPKIMLSGCAAVLLLTGCTTYFEEQRNVSARQRTEVDNQRTEIEQLKARIEGLEKLQQDLDSRMAAMRAENDKQRQEAREQLAAMDRVLKTAVADRDMVKKEIIDDLTPKINRIAEMMRSQSAPARAAVVQHPAGSGKSREHVVRAGETLSAIAAAYKVKISALVQTNNLKSADSLKVGQRLIIPE